MAGSFFNSVWLVIGEDITKYIEAKKKHLESTGYEDGHYNLNFTTFGEDNLKDLVDVSIGIKEKAEIKHLRGVETRFGVRNKSPFLDHGGGAIAMPNLTPKDEGIIRFRENKFSPGLSFPIKFYPSVLIPMIPKEYWKMRIEGEFFDLVFNPYNQAANWNFKLGHGLRMEISKFQDALKLMNSLGPEKKIFQAELILKDLPKLELKGIKFNESDFAFFKELRTLEAAKKIISKFDMTDSVDVSLMDIFESAIPIRQLSEMLDKSTKPFRLEFGIDGGEFDLSSEIACLLYVTAPIGSHIFGIVIAMIGKSNLLDDGRYRVENDRPIIERQFVFENNEAIDEKSFIEILEEIESKYEKDYFVVVLYDKTNL